jgi:hypothetical protein
MPKIFLKIKRLQKYEILSTHSSHVKLSYVEGENLTKYTQTSSLLIRKPKKKKKKKKRKKKIMQKRYYKKKQNFKNLKIKNTNKVFLL